VPVEKFDDESTVAVVSESKIIHQRLVTPTDQTTPPTKLLGATYRSAHASQLL
jgi:hypothetical protein